MPLGGGLIRLFGWQVRYPVAPEHKIPLLLSLYWLAPLLLWLYGRYSAGAPLASYGVAWNQGFLLSLLVGLGLGVAGIGILLIWQWLAGWLRWQAPPPTISPTDSAVVSPPGSRQVALYLTQIALPITLLALAISWVEELVFRGFVVNQLRLDYAPWLMVLLGSLIFAVLHLVWDGLAATPQLPGLWLMGTVLILARWVDGGQLGLPCGLHAGWIGALAFLDTAQLIQRSPQAPRWLLGNPELPLTNGLTLLLLLATGGVLWGFFPGS